MLFEPIRQDNRLKKPTQNEPIMRYNRLMTRYNWQKPDWPHFQYDLSSLQDTLFSIAEKAGLIRGKLSHLPEAEQTEAALHVMVEEAVKTSEIEGEYISRIDVRSSLKNQLGLNPKIERVHDKRAHSIAELMLDVRNTYQEALTEEKLFDWHLMLFSSSSNPHLRIAYWRTDKEPMQIVSGRHERWIVHFEAPPAERVPDEMKAFLHWFNSAPQNLQFAPVRAAIAHLYFESIHPFDDGNGRIGRAIAEKALLQGFGYPAILSLSHVIDADKKAYYAALNTASKFNEITEWVRYFVNVILNAQIAVEAQIDFILKKSVFWDEFKDQLNERELKVIRRMLNAGIEGFEGGMTAKKYMAITQTSKATATRDLHHLFSVHALRQMGGGRSVRYELNI